MCSCGGLLTGWCYECGDDVCSHCGCLVDHEAEALAADDSEAMLYGEPTP